MSKQVKITIDGVECIAEKGQFIVQVAKDNGIYIPTLCNYGGTKPHGSCRICNVRVNGRLMTACTTPVAEGMEIENNIPEINELRKAIIELFFVDGNHYCPACEKSGNCELQALGYRYGMLAPRFPYQFKDLQIDASHPKIIKDQNRCIKCKRCIRTIKDSKGRNIFAYKKRGENVQVVVDPVLAHELDDELAQKAMDVCPVGSIIVRGKGFSTPIGARKYDTQPIGSDVENQNQKG